MYKKSYSGSNTPLPKSRASKSKVYPAIAVAQVTKKFEQLLELMLLKAAKLNQVIVVLDRTLHALEKQMDTLQSSNTTTFGLTPPRTSATPNPSHDINVTPSSPYNVSSTASPPVIFKLQYAIPLLLALVHLLDWTILHTP